MADRVRRPRRVWADQGRSGLFRRVCLYSKSVNWSVEFILQDAHNAAMSGKTGLAGKGRRFQHYAKMSFPFRSGACMPGVFVTVVKHLNFGVGKG